MISTEHWLVHEHTSFEITLNKLCKMIDFQNWESIEACVTGFIKLLNIHIGQEEEVLFPAYELKVGNLNQPVVKLRDEHNHIASVVRDVVSSITLRDIDALRDSFGYLEGLMRSHHEKEEMIFLPMASHILFSEREKLSQALSDFTKPRISKDWGVEI